MAGSAIADSYTWPIGPMRRAAVLVVFLVLLVAAHEHAVESQGGPVRQLAPGVFSRQGDKDVRQPANTSWVEFRTFVVVIEANTPWGIRAILPEIRKTTGRVRRSEEHTSEL